jgi:hypothetical protein
MSVGSCVVDFAAQYPTHLPPDPTPEDIAKLVQRFMPSPVLATIEDTRRADALRCVQRRKGEKFTDLKNWEGRGDIGCPMSFHGQDSILVHIKMKLTENHSEIFFPDGSKIYTPALCLMGRTAKSLLLVCVTDWCVRVCVCMFVDSFIRLIAIRFFFS